MEFRSITKGANLELPAGIHGLQLVVGWSDAGGESEIDVQALLLASNRRVRSDADLVFYNQPASPDDSVRHLGKRTTDSGTEELIAVDFDIVPADVATITIAASAGGAGCFGDLAGLHMIALDDAGAPMVRYDISDATTENAFVFAEVYRRGAGWKLRAVGQGWSSGLAGLATDFGVTVDDDASAADSGKGPAFATAEPAHPPVDGDDAPDGDRVPGPSPELQKPGTESGEELIDVAEEDDQIADVIPAPEISTPTPATPNRPAKGVSTHKPGPARSLLPVLSLAADKNWQPARLFSVCGVGSGEEQEMRATSALLATMQAVRPFARGIVARLGAPAGTVETFAEVPFRLGERIVIPDGVIRVARAGRLWTGLLEVKTGAMQLRRDQVEKYLDVCRDHRFDTVVTLSNEIAPGAGEHPVAVDDRKLRKAGLLHLSWAEVLQEARMVLNHRGVETPLQAWILAEFIRYLQHPRSGVCGFEDMGPAWVPVREAIKTGTLHANYRKAASVADAWLRLIRYLCLLLTAELGVTVGHSMPRKLATDPAARRHAIAARLVSDGVLGATLRIPGAAGPVTVVADLGVGAVRISVQLPAPQTAGSQRRISWLLRQLKDTAPNHLLLEAGSADRIGTTCKTLADVRATPAILLADRKVDITSFRITRNFPMGPKRSGVKGAFVPSVLAAFETFYGTVVQGLRPWSPTPPHLSADIIDEATTVSDSATGKEISPATPQ